MAERPASATSDSSRPAIPRTGAVDVVAALVLVVLLGAASWAVTGVIADAYHRRVGPTPWWWHYTSWLWPIPAIAKLLRRRRPTGRAHPPRRRTAHPDGPDDQTPRWWRPLRPEDPAEVFWWHQLHHHAQALTHALNDELAHGPAQDVAWRVSAHRHHRLRRREVQDCLCFTWGNGPQIEIYQPIRHRRFGTHDWVDDQPPHTAADQLRQQVHQVHADGLLSPP